MKSEFKVKDVCPSAQEFVKVIKLAMQGVGKPNAEMGEYIFCKNMGISKPQMDETDEEDVLSHSLNMMLEAKHNKR